MISVTSTVKCQSTYPECATEGVVRQPTRATQVSLHPSVRLKPVWHLQ